MHILQLGLFIFSWLIYLYHMGNLCVASYLERSTW